MIRRLLIIIVFAGIFQFPVFGQFTQTLYNMHGIPQVSYMNPAIQPSCKGYFSLPVVSATEVGVGNSSLTLTDVILQHPTEDSLITFLHPLADKEEFLNNLGDDNFFFEELHTNVLAFGFRAGNLYFSIGASERQNLTVHYPKDLMNFALYGNQYFGTEAADFSALRVEANYYHEYSLGVSYQYGNFTFGLRPKVLFGMLNLSMENNTFNLYSGTDSLYIDADMKVNINAPVEIITDAENNIEDFLFDENMDYVDYALNTDNMGLAIDVGVTYKPIENLMLSLSLIDLGYINWKSHVSNLAVDGSYSFNGLDVSSEFDENSDVDIMEDLLDTLETIFTVSNTAESYSTNLVSKVYFGASYYLTPKVDFSFLSRFAFYGEEMKSAYTISANTRPFNGLGFSVSYSIMNNTYNNIGLGLILKPGPFQLYVISDNVSALLWGHETSSVHLRFGLNFVFGCNKKRKLMKDKPMFQSTF